MAQERSIEVKVGALILVALLILGLFVFVMGGLRFDRMYPLYIDFDNPGGLQTGAAVKIGGITVGSVKELEFHGGAVDPQTGRRTLVRVKIAVSSRVKNTVFENASFYVTTQGVLGEQFLAIEPGTADRPFLKEGAVVKGIDPPRLDLFLAKAYALLDLTLTGINDNKELLQDAAHDGASLLRSLNGILGDNRAPIARTMTNLEQTSAETRAMAREARAKYVTNPKIDRTVDHVAQIAADLEPMVQDAKASLANVRRATDAVGTPEQQAKVRKAIDDLAQLAQRANATAADAQAITRRVKRGEGTVGALLMDEQVFDDVQEMVRDLKHNPWKFLWKR